MTRIKAEARQIKSTELKQEADGKSDLRSFGKTDDHDAPLKIGRYHCLSDKRHGNLSVYTDRVSFEMHLTGNEIWNLRYEDIKEVQKVRAPLQMVSRTSTM